MDHTETAVTRDVILDLLPAVRSGTASADSRKLVESFLTSDPELAARAALLPYPSAELELQALSRTRSRLHRQQWSLALAIFFTALPMTFVLGDGGLKFFMLRDAPAVALMSLVVGAGMWLGFLRHRKSF